MHIPARSSTVLEVFGALILILLLLSAPFGLHAQEASSTDEVAAGEIVLDKSPELDPARLGIPTESIPNASEVIGDFVVGPGRYEASIRPGESRTVNVLLTNRTGIDRRFDVEVEDTAGSSDGSESVVLLGDDRGPFSVKDFISAPAFSFHLRHGERARLPVTITIPPDAEPGGFYGSVLVTTTSLKPEESNEAGFAAARSPVIQRIGMLVFITVPGDVNQEGVLRDVSLQPDQRWFEKGPINFLITYENTGDVHLNPYGEISITNMSGEEVGFVELEPWFAMPQSVRLREVTWNREMLYGKYTATVLLNRGYDDIIDEKTVTFWIVPWKFIVVGLLGIFIVLFLIRSFFRTFEFKRRA